MTSSSTSTVKERLGNQENPQGTTTPSSDRPQPIAGTPQAPVADKKDVKALELNPILPANAPQMPLDRKDEIKETPFNPAATLNVVFLGTSDHHEREYQRTLLTELINKMDDEKQFVHVIDGIGGEPPQPKRGEKLSANPMLGTYDFKCEYNTGTGKLISTKTPNPKKSFIARKAQLTAKGYKEAMNEVRLICHRLLAAGKTPLRLNGIGFSRAADTFGRIASDLQAQYGEDQIQINIFAVDAVAGPRRGMAMKARIITKSVNEYHAILMEDEQKMGFEPQDKSRMLIEDPTKTIVQYRRYRGTHGDALRVEVDKSGKTIKAMNESSSLLAWDDLHQFIKRHGIVMKEGNEHILLVRRHKIDNFNARYYDQQLGRFTEEQRLAEYTKQTKFTLSEKRSGTRTFVKKKEDYVQLASHYFRDNNHQRLFAKFYPHYFDYFFQCNANGSTRDQVLTDAKKIRENDDLRQTLYDVGYQDFTHKEGADFEVQVKQLQQVQQPQKFPDPKGMYLHAEEFFDDKPLVRSPLTQLLFSIKTAANHAALDESNNTLTKEIAHELLQKVSRAMDVGQPITKTTFRFECQGRLKLAVFEALEKLRKHSELNGFCYQLEEIMYQSPEILVFLNIFVKLKNDPTIKDIMCYILCSIEKIINDAALQKVDKITSLIDSIEKIFNMHNKIDEARQNQIRSALIQFYRNIICHTLGMLEPNSQQIAKLDTIIQILMDNKNQLGERISLIKDELIAMENLKNPAGSPQPNQSKLAQMIKLNFTDYIFAQMIKANVDKDENETRIKHALLNTLQKMKQENITNSRLLKQIINRAMYHAAQQRELENETPFEKLLRKIQAVLITCKDNPLTEQQNHLFIEFENNCKRKLERSLAFTLSRGP